MISNPRSRRYRERHPDRVKNYMKRYAKKNRARLSASAKRHRASNRKRYNETARQYRLRNRDKINARRAETRLIGGLITPAQYDALLVAQNGVCAICKSTKIVKACPGHQRRRTLCVDHDHRTKHVRGLLCVGCNAGLGHFKDRIDLLNAALAYLAEGAVP